MEDVDAFFDQAKSPTLSPAVGSGDEKKDDEAPRRSKRNSPQPQRKPAADLTLTLPGQQEEDIRSSVSPPDANPKHYHSKRRLPTNKRGVLGLTSPSELSQVSTLPPSPPAELPASPGEQEEIQVNHQLPTSTEQQEQPVEITRQRDDDEPREPADSHLPAVGDVDNDIAAQVNDNEDEGDDLAPPVLHDDDDEDDDVALEAPPVQEPERKQESLDDSKLSTKVHTPTHDLSDTESDEGDFPRHTMDAGHNDHDDDDDDKEGPGFSITHDPETPASLRQERKRKEQDEIRSRTKKKGRPSMNDSVVSNRKSKKKKRHVLFSPQGIPVANRDYENIPLAHLVEASPDDEEKNRQGGGVRRSKRARCQPLAFWKNEKLEYAPYDDTDSDLAEAIGDMPVPKNVVKALPTPYRKRKPVKKIASRSTSSSTKKKMKKSTQESSSDDEQSVFDSSRLKRKYKGNLLRGDTATVWDDSNDDSNDLSTYQICLLFHHRYSLQTWTHLTHPNLDFSTTSRFVTRYIYTEVVAYASQMEPAELPHAERTEEEGNIVGSAAQAFNVPSDEHGNYVGYIMGNLKLPPRAIKDAESVGPCSQAFTVCTGQKGALEVAFSDLPGGVLEEDSAQRFLLSPGDLFRVPPGNTYRLQNHSTKTSCTLTWIIIRPRNLPEVEVADTTE